MELSTFVKETLLQITTGVAEAQAEAKHGVISPANIQQTADSVRLGVSALTVVEFEVEVAVDEGSGNTARLGVLSSFIGAGIQGDRRKEISNCSVLKFRVPVMLPEAPQK